MTDSVLTNEMKRYTVIVSIMAGHGDLKIARFLKVARSFVSKICNELKSEKDDVMSVSKRKKHVRRSDSKRTPEFVVKVKQMIDANEGRPMRSIAKALQVSERTIE